MSSFGQSGYGPNTATGVTKPTTNDKDADYLSVTIFQNPWKSIEKTMYFMKN